MPKKRMTAKQKTTERIAHPQTPADLILALKDPNSPASKKCLNEILLNQIIISITEKIIHRFMMRELIATQLEKHVIETESHARALAVESDERRYRALPPVNVDAERLRQLSIEEFEKQLKKRSETIKTLQEQVTGLSKQLTDLHKAVKTNTKDWQELSVKLATTFATDLVANDVKLMTASGKEIDIKKEAGQKIIAEVFAGPAPAEILEKFGGSWQKYQAAAPSVDASIPAPPPRPLLPAGFADAGVMAGKGNVGQELKLIAACAGEDSIPALMQAMKNNAAARKLLPGANLALNKNLAQSEQGVLFAKAIDNYTKIAEVRQALDQSKTQLATENELLKAEKEVFQKMEGLVSLKSPRP